MTQDIFLATQKKIFDEIIVIGATKGKEYARDNDRLANFKRIAEELKIEPEKVCFIFLKKHYDAIVYYIQQGKLESEETPLSRFADVINYFTLLYAIMKEKEDIRTSTRR